jgi:hypothetical protein
MIDIGTISFWILVLFVLYLLGPAAIYVVGLITLLCLLSSSSLATVAGPKAQVVTPVAGSGVAVSTGPDAYVVTADPYQGYRNLEPGVRDPYVVNNDTAAVIVRPSGYYDNAYSVQTCVPPQIGGHGGYPLGVSYADGLAGDNWELKAFRNQPYNDKAYGYGYYDGYDYVI